MNFDFLEAWEPRTRSPRRSWGAILVPGFQGINQVPESNLIFLEHPVLGTKIAPQDFLGDLGLHVHGCIVGQTLYGKLGRCPRTTWHCANNLQVNERPTIIYHLHYSKLKPQHKLANKALSVLLRQVCARLTCQWSAA